MTALAPRVPRAVPPPIGLVAILVTVVMLFTTFTAALLIRRSGDDWIPISLPGIVWVNTAIILLSSVALERARTLARGSRGDAASWLLWAGILGFTFLAGQVMAWRTLAAHGVFLASNPHAAFFYMLSAVHGAHVVGGLGALGWAFGRARAGFSGAVSLAGLTHVAIYWHVVGVVWLWILAALLTL